MQLTVSFIGIVVNNGSTLYDASSSSSCKCGIEETYLRIFAYYQCIIRFYTKFSSNPHMIGQIHITFAALYVNVPIRSREMSWFFFLLLSSLFTVDLN